MQQNKQNKNSGGNQNQNKNGNFFNNNPLLIFALFSILTVGIFKAFLTDDGTTGENASGGVISQSQSQNVSYYDLKKLIEVGKISYVGIGESSIKATSAGEPKASYIARRVIPDETLIPMLEKANVKYGAYTEKNWVTDLVFGWVLPVFIFFAIWMFLTNRMQKNMGGGLLGIGSMKKLVNSE